MMDNGPLRSCTSSSNRPSRWRGSLPRTGSSFPKILGSGRQGQAEGTFTGGQTVLRLLAMAACGDLARAEVRVGGEIHASPALHGEIEPESPSVYLHLQEIQPLPA